MLRSGLSDVIEQLFILGRKVLHLLTQRNDSLLHTVLLKSPSGTTLAGLLGRGKVGSSTLLVLIQALHWRAFAYVALRFIKFDRQAAFKVGVSYIQIQVSLSLLDQRSSQLEVFLKYDIHPL